MIPDPIFQQNSPTIPQIGTFSNLQIITMAFDIEMIKKTYGKVPEAARKRPISPLSLTEKIIPLAGNATEATRRGKSYVDFAPDRVANTGRHRPDGPVYSSCKAEGPEWCRSFHRALRSPDPAKVDSKPTRPCRTMKAARV